MLNFKTPTNHEPTCVVTHGSMGHVDGQQPPTRRKPFSAILGHNFVQKVELLLPEEVFEIVKAKIDENAISPPKYSRVTMCLKDLLQGEFFNEYIKKGNILMLSEGRIGVDNVYSLREGILTLHLDKESYERAGLVGKTDGVKGSRGTKPWWIVEINLRLPSMLHGKKAFDRILYAFRTVLSKPVEWLFHDLRSTLFEKDPLQEFNPDTKIIEATISKKFQVEQPNLSPPTDPDLTYGRDFEDFSTDTFEWLSLALLKSPRLDPADDIDTFLSRYSPPGDVESVSLVRCSWKGLMSPSWSHKLFVDILLALSKDHWFAYSISGFSDKFEADRLHSLILKLPKSSMEYVLWDID